MSCSIQSRVARWNFLKIPIWAAKYPKIACFLTKNPKVHATSSPGSFLRYPPPPPGWHASFLQRRPISTQIRASIVGNKSQKNPKPKYLKKKIPEKSQLLQKIPRSWDKIPSMATLIQSYF